MTTSVRFYHMILYKVGFCHFQNEQIFNKKAQFTRTLSMTLRIRAKVLLHVWSYDISDMMLSTEYKRCHMKKRFPVSISPLTYKKGCFKCRHQHQSKNSKKSTSHKLKTFASMDAQTGLSLLFAHIVYNCFASEGSHNDITITIFSINF